jgi:hypothetical protein
MRNTKLTFPRTPPLSLPRPRSYSLDGKQAEDEEEEGDEEELLPIITY